MSFTDEQWKRLNEQFAISDAKLMVAQEVLVERLDALESQNIGDNLDNMDTRLIRMEMKFKAFKEGEDSVLKVEDEHIKHMVNVNRTGVSNLFTNYGELKEVLRNCIYTSRNAFLQIKSILKDSDLMKASTVDKSYTEQLEKLDSKALDRQTVKQPSPFKFCSECGYSGNVRHIVCPECHNSYFEKNKTEKKDCNKCDLYGECDHQGAYKQKNGKWCYEDSGGEKDRLGEGGEDGAFSLSCNSTDSKLPETIRPCDGCKHRFPTLSERCYYCHSTNNFNRFEPKAEPEKDLYELYLKDEENREINFKKVTHPFTEYNNMVHRGIGLKLMPYNTKEKLIEEFLKDLNYWITTDREGISTLYILKDIRSKWQGRRK